MGNEQSTPSQKKRIHFESKSVWKILIRKLLLMRQVLTNISTKFKNKNTPAFQISLKFSSKTQKCPQWTATNIVFDGMNIPQIYLVHLMNCETMKISSILL